MPIYQWKQTFLDVRICGVEAESEEEAIKKRDEGGWLFEDTVGFHTYDREEGFEMVEDE